MYSIFIVYFYQHSSARGGAGTRSAVARAGRRAGGGGGAQGRMGSRGVGRAGGAPSSPLSAARSPSLLTFYEGRDRQRAPFPSQRVVVAGGGRGDAGAEGRRRGDEEADGGGWMHKESWARVPATRNGHRGQLRMHAALTRSPRAECSGRARFVRWAAEAALVAVVVSTGSPSQGSIPAPIPRSPASGGACRRGLGLDTCWRRGSAGSAVAEAEAQSWHRSLHPTQPAPLLWRDEGASLSTIMQSRGRQRSSFMSALGGGGRRQQSQRRGGGCASHSRRPPAHLWRAASPSPRVLWRPMGDFCCPRPLLAPPLPPHAGGAGCDATLARPTRPLLPHQSDTPVPRTATDHNHTTIHRRKACTLYSNTFQHARGCIADGARSSFGPLTVLVAKGQNGRFGAANTSKHHSSIKAPRTRGEYVTYSIILFHLRAFALARTCPFAP
jgi:hypothetical protein